jgi:hypothetical protein
MGVAMGGFLGLNMRLGRQMSKTKCRQQNVDKTMSTDKMS